MNEPSGAPEKNHKTVLLAVSDGAFDRSALRYALSISERMRASLEILYVSASEKDRKGLKVFLSEVERVGFRFSLVMKHGCVKKAILDYTDKRSEILFVIVGAERELNIGCDARENSFENAWKNMKCPLVVVSKNGAGSGTKKVSRP
ncbi:MAG: universal stress protein [Nitrospirae bacterium]|nr:universal stress protein [Nitrospirota bacterium]